MGRFQGFSLHTIEFFMALGLNNSKTFFEAHRQDYEQHVLQPMRSLAYDLAPAMLDIDPQFDARPVIGGAISRIYRDARRVRGGAPYRDYMWLAYRRKDDSGKLGFYYDIGSGSTSMGMGVFDANTAYMKALRRYIYENQNRYKAALPDGFSLLGPDYKRPPLSAEDETVDRMLRKRFFHFNLDLPMELVFGPGLVDELLAGYTRLQPMYDFLRNRESTPESPPARDRGNKK